MCYNVMATKGGKNMAQANINIRIDENLKKQFDHICDELGLTMTNVLNLCIKTIVRFEGIPFEVSTHIPNAETRKAIIDAEKGIGLNGPFTSTKELMKSLLEDDDDDN